MITVTAPVWLWSAGNGGWHFLTVPAEEAVEIRLQSLAARGGFGSVRIEASIGDVRWRTSLFPHRESGGYLLPIKADVRQRGGFSAGDVIEVAIEIV